MTNKISIAALAVQHTISSYVNDYEMQGDDGCHTPNEIELALIEDAINGLLVDDDFLKTFNTWQSMIHGKVELDK